MDQKSNNSFVSIVIPVRNEVRHIRTCLESLLSQDYAKDRFELIVADGNSDDGSREIIRDLQTSNENLKLIDNPKRIVSAALNLAIRESQGEFIVRVDGHTVVEQNYLTECVNALRRSGADTVGGLMRPIGTSLVQQAIVLATSTPLVIGNSYFHYSNKEGYVDTVYMGAFRREVLFRVGLFDERLGKNQDYELNYRIRATGGKIFLCPRIRSYYHVRDGLKELVRQYYQYGFWKASVLGMHPRSLKIRHLPPIFLVAGIVAGVLAALLFQSGSVFLWLLLSAYSLYLVSVTSILLLQTRNRQELIFLLPIVISTLHVSWGSGLLRGVPKILSQLWKWLGEHDQLDR